MNATSLVVKIEDVVGRKALTTRSQAPRVAEPPVGSHQPFGSKTGRLKPSIVGRGDRVYVGVEQVVAMAAPYQPEGRDT
jgi:hypothetical protein